MIVTVPMPMEILIATGNSGKFREMVAVLSERLHPAENVVCKSLDQLPITIDEPHEDGETFLANATLKARYYSKAAGLWALADDSGLEVDALGGEPGVHSAYFDRAAAQLPRTERDRANNAKLVAALQDISSGARTARYRCVLVLADGDTIIATAEGTFEGLMLIEPRGTGGFGYDPYFFLPELGKTVAELSAEEKNAISHRGKALRKLRSKLLSLPAATGNRSRKNPE